MHAVNPLPSEVGSSRGLSRGDIKTLFLAALGGALEFYDFVIFLFVANQLGQLFCPTGTASWLAKLQVYGIFAAGYLARPLGGIVMAHFGDRSGRKKMFTLSVLLMALPTLAIGCLPVYGQIGIAAPLLLLMLRIIQGVAIGGEVPGAWVFVAEHAPRGRVGFACGSLTSGLTIGILIGSLVAAWLHHVLSADQMLDWGWRVPFVLGGAFGFVAVWLRRWLRETPVFAAMRERKELSRELPLGAVLKGHIGAVVMSMLVTWMLTAAILVLILMLPGLVQKPFHIKQDDVSLGNSLAAFCLSIGCLFYGWLVDRIGVAWALMIGSITLLLGTYGLYGDLASGGAHFLTWYPIVGFLVGAVGVIPSLMVAVFPAAIRFSGLSFAYNVAYAVFGASTATLIGYMAERWKENAPAHYVALTAAVSVLVALYVLIRRKPLAL